MNKKEIALKLLLEEKGFYVDELHEMSDRFIIEGERTEDVNTIPFEISVERDEELQIGQSFLNLVIMEIVKFEDEVKNIARDFTTPREPKRDSSFGQYYNMYETFGKAIVNRHSLGDATRDRKTGKSTVIADLSYEFSIPVVVEDKTLKKLFNKYLTSHDVYSVEDASDRGYLTSVTHPIILVDEISMKSYTLLIEQGFKVIGIVRP